jgi:hypothetical protein
VNFEIVGYRYAKGKVCVRTPSDGSGWKTRAARLAEALGGRWTHRAGGYLMTSRRAEVFALKYAQGWDANGFTGELIPPA